MYTWSDNKGKRIDVGIQNKIWLICKPILQRQLSSKSYQLDDVHAFHVLTGNGENG